MDITKGSFDSSSASVFISYEELSPKIDKNTIRCKGIGVLKTLHIARIEVGFQSSTTSDAR